MSTKQRTIDLASDTSLAAIVALTDAGEEVIITRGGVEIAHAVGTKPSTGHPSARRVPGRLAGKITLDDSFFDPLPEQELGGWEGR